MARARDALDDLRLVHKVLDRLRIPHALIGGWASVAWGAVRATKDLDMMVLVDPAGRERLMKTFQRLGYDVERRKGGMDDPIPELFRLTPKNLGSRPAVDFLPASKSFDLDALARAVALRLGHWLIPVVCREDLIAMKLAAGGGLDIQDARFLLDIHARTLDQRLLESSCRRLGALRLLQRVCKAGW